MVNIPSKNGVMEVVSKFARSSKILFQGMPLIRPQDYTKILLQFPPGIKARRVKNGRMIRIGSFSNFKKESKNSKLIKNQNSVQKLSRSSDGQNLFSMY